MEGEKISGRGCRGWLDIRWTVEYAGPVEIANPWGGAAEEGKLKDPVSGPELETVAGVVALVVVLGILGVIEGMLVAGARVEMEGRFCLVFFFAGGCSSCADVPCCATCLSCSAFDALVGRPRFLPEDPVEA